MFDGHYYEFLALYAEQGLLIDPVVLAAGGATVVASLLVVLSVPPIELLVLSVRLGCFYTKRKKNIADGSLNRFVTLYNC